MDSGVCSAGSSPELTGEICVQVSKLLSNLDASYLAALSFLVCEIEMMVLCTWFLWGLGEQCHGAWSIAEEVRVNVTCL